jgi:glycogen operon protein
MSPADWQNPHGATLIAVLYTKPARAILVLHAGWQPVPVRLPAARPAHDWTLACDTGGEAAPDAAGTVAIGPRSVVLCTEKPSGDGRAARPPQATTDATLNRLATQAGLSLAWWDVQGSLHIAPPDTLQAVLAAQGVPASSENQARDSLASLAARRDLRPMQAALVTDPATPATLRLGPGTGGRDRWLTIDAWATNAAPIRLKIAADDGTQAAFEAADGSRVAARRINLPVLPAGRYRLALEGVAATTALTVAPPQCFVPAGLSHGARAFGVAAHLYTLRHEADQGVGDFTALADLAAIAGPQGVAALGLNPLHALFRSNRDRASPYHPADRRFLDAIYIDVTRLGPLGESPPVRAALQADAAAITHLRAGAMVEYEAAWAVKDRVPPAATACAASRCGKRWRKPTARIGTCGLPNCATRPAPPSPPSRRNTRTRCAMARSCNILPNKALLKPPKPRGRPAAGWGSTETWRSAARPTAPKPGPNRGFTCRAFPSARRPTCSARTARCGTCRHPTRSPWRRKASPASPTCSPPTCATPARCASTTSWASRACS